MITKRWLAVSLMVGMSSLVQFTVAESSIRDFDFKTYLSEQHKDCREYAKEAVYIDRVDYFDLDGDGQEEIMITASSCNTGTAGPDILC
jgi:hypothetical protein